MATGWTVDELAVTPFSDVVDLFDHWKSFPPIHVMIGRYLGYEEHESKPKSIPNVIETAQAVKLLSGGKTQKLSSAPERDQAIFKRMREEARKENAGQ